MKPTNGEQEDKNTAGAFIVGATSSSAPSEKETPLLPHDSLDERLGDASSYQDNLATENKDESTLKENDTPLQEVSVVDITKNMPLRASQQKEALNPFAPIGINIETTVLGKSPQAIIDISTLIPQTEASQQETYHTISGGPETFMDLTKKDITTVIRTEEKYSTIGMPIAEPEPPMVQEKKTSLGAVVFQVLACVDFIFFMVSLGLPTLITILVEQKYLLLGADGVYSYGNFSFPRVIPDNALHFTVALTVFSLFAIFISSSIDMVSGPTAKLGIKTIIFFEVLGLLGGLSYYFISNSPGAVSFFRVILTPYGIVI